MSEEQEVFLNHIQKKGLKRTAQRDLILDVSPGTGTRRECGPNYGLSHPQAPDRRGTRA